MRVRDVMTENPACCGPDMPLQDVARMMADCDCGEIPVVDAQRRPVGVVTDRDIAIRAVAEGRDTRQTRAREVMSQPVITVNPDSSLEDCRRKMETNQIRRVPVVDDSGACCGMVAQADIARNSAEEKTGDLVRDVSRPTRASSSVKH